MTHAEGQELLLDYSELLAVTEALGIPSPPQRLVRTPDAAVEFSKTLHGAAVLKLISTELIHKSDVGAVRLDVSGTDEVRAAAVDLGALAASLGLKEGNWSILVQEMARSSDVEIFVGIKRDKTFGPVVIVGVGGRLVELLPARSIRRCPVSTREARNMLSEIPLGKMLAGFRGSKDHLTAVAELIAKTSRLPEKITGFQEADFNPVLVTDRGPLAVDCRAVVSKVQSPSQGTMPHRELDLRPLLEPRGILVIGASSSNALMPGNRVLAYLRKHRYAGLVTVLHPSAGTIDGFPAVKSMDDLPRGKIDLACVAVAAASCADVVERCGKAGIRAAVVLSSGFSEVGNRELEAKLADAAKRVGLLLCGPNTVGIMSPSAHVHVCFSQSQDVKTPHPGPAAFVVQSGALGGSLVAQAWQRGIGVSRFISVGNQAALTSTDYLNYLVTDAATGTVAMLLEGVDDGGALLQASGRLHAAGKSLIVFKAGRTADGAKAVQSHTGSIAGDYAVYSAVLKQTGAILVESITEFLDVLALQSSGVRINAGSRMAVLSTSGGACAMVADLCARQGFRTPELSAALRAKLAEVIPAFGTTVNPIDVTGQVTTEPKIYGRALELVLASDEIDAVTVMLTTIADPQAEQIAAEIVGQVARQRKPVLICWTIPPELARDGLGVFAKASMPVFDDPARAIRAASLIAG